MSRARRAAIFLGFVAGWLGRAPEVQANSPQVSPLLNFRWRPEIHDTLSADPVLDSHYGFTSLRLRFGLDLKWKRVTLHGLGQASGAVSLPASGSFGIGTAYFASSGGADTSPGQVGLAELSLTLKPGPRWSFTAGRIGLRDGVEVLTGDARFDNIKQTRLAERLLGTWDWVNVGRRFDGVTAAYDRERWNLFGFGARVLAGGVDYDDAFEQLDGVDVYGAVFTAKRGWWLPESEVRVISILERDARPSTKASLGDRLLIDALGASLVGLYPRGHGAVDLMLWAAYERGDYGAQSHSAAAFIAEGGYGWVAAAWAPWLRGGIAYASGDGNPADGRHGTFFNMVPTNHKFYGYQDVVAFQNLTDTYGELRLAPHPKVRLGLEAQLLRLANTRDAWYGGSGAANNTAFGYTTTRLSGERELPADIGVEVDFLSSWAVHRRVALELGLSRFQGGDAAELLYPVRSSFTWFYFQAVWNH